MAGKNKKTYVVDYTRDETGYWFARVRSIKGCHTQARTIDQAKERIREALLLFTTSSDENMILKDNIRLPQDVRTSVRRCTSAKRLAERANTNAQKITKSAVSALIKDMNLSMRDAAFLLKVSHQRIHQVTSSAM